MKIAYYVYIYLDPRRKGKYCCNDVCFLYEPIYVGKGHNGRCRDFLNHNRYCKNKIKKILQNLKRNPIVVIFQESLIEQKIFELEKKLIKEIGRSDLDLGPLTNLTDGGEGPNNPSEETRLKMSLNKKLESRLKLSLKQKENNTAKCEGSRKKISQKASLRCIGKGNPMFGKKHSDESRLKMSKSRIGKKVVFTDQHIENLKKSWEKRKLNKLILERQNENCISALG